jgi:hypothetical protein
MDASWMNTYGGLGLVGPRRSEPQRVPVCTYRFSRMCSCMMLRAVMQQQQYGMEQVDPEPITPFDIIQPVLQYPVNQGGGANANDWGVRSWCVVRPRVSAPCRLFCCRAPVAAHGMAAVAAGRLEHHLHHHLLHRYHPPTTSSGTSPSTRARSCRPRRW